MKTITIGRDLSCDISIDDNMISRRHALLRIHPTGKMELVDMSSNGTFVNGVKLASNVPFPLTRKDTVSFANVRQLDWTEVPNPLSWVKWAIVSVLSAVLLILLIFILCRSCDSKSFDRYESNGTEVTPVSNSNSTEVKTDSTKQTSKPSTDKDTKSDDSSAETKESSTAKESEESKGNWADEMIKADNAKKAAAKKPGKAQQDADKTPKPEKSKKQPEGDYSDLVI